MRPSTTTPDFDPGPPTEPAWQYHSAWIADYQFDVACTAIGAAGWELVSMRPGHMGDTAAHHCFFKRPLR